MSGVAYAGFPTLYGIEERATAPVTPATTEGYIYALSDDSHLYFKNDAGTAFDLTSGSTAWDDIGDPDANNEIDFADYISELKLGSSGDFRIGDGESDYVKFGADGCMTFVGAATIALPNGAAPTVDAVGEVAVDTDADGDLIDDGLATYYDGSKQMWIPAISSLAGLADNQALTYDAANDQFIFEAQSGSPPAWVATYPAGSFTYPTANPAPLSRDVGANLDVFIQQFDDSTDEYVTGQFLLPDISGTGGDNVTFSIVGYAATASDDSVVFVFHEKEAGDSETWDDAFNTVSSGAEACDVTQDNIVYFTWQETLTNLEWSDNDFVKFKISRDADNESDTLVGDFNLLVFSITIPRS